MDELLQLVLDVYKHPNLAGTDISVKLEVAFMMGLRRARKFELRESFFELLSRYIRVSEVAESHDGIGLWPVLTFTTALTTCSMIAIFAGTHLSIAFG